MRVKILAYKIPIKAAYMMPTILVSAGRELIFFFIKPCHQPIRKMDLTGGKMCNV